METTMRSRIHTFVVALITGSTFAMAAPAGAAAQALQRNDRFDQRDRDVYAQRGSDQRAYDSGYQQGLREGERDARRSGAFDPDPRNRRGRESTDFDSGFAAGYRAGFERVRASVNRRDNRGVRTGQIFGGSPANGAYREPASARGYSDGYERGLDDARHHNRYDPVGEKDYRDGDEGYNSSYGSKDAYKNNYRTGFRQGYEDGYRGAVRR
jgi:hypothetical protein